MLILWAFTGAVYQAERYHSEGIFKEEEKPVPRKSIAPVESAAA